MGISPGVKKNGPLTVGSVGYSWYGFVESTQKLSSLSLGKFPNLICVTFSLVSY